MQTEVLDLMKTHACFQGLEEDALSEIAEHMEVMRCKPNEYVHQPNTRVTHIYFIVRGTLKATRRDLHGNEKVLGLLSRDDQFGALTGGALSEPLPEGIVAQTNCTLLKLEYEKALTFTPKYPKFRFNVLQAVARGFRRNFIEDKSKPQPLIVTVFHSSPATRRLTQRIVRRLAELGEQPCVLSDRNEEKHEEAVSYATLGKENCELSISAIQEQVIHRRKLGRLFIDVDSALDHELASQLIELSDSVMWCVQAGDEKSATAQLKINCVSAPGCREKINVVWLLADGCQTSPFAPELKELAAYDFKVSFSEPKPPLGKTLSSGVERLVHYLRGIKIGLALGGGAARGMAHLGVLQVLEQNGIVVDMIAGTSAGALTGIPYASGGSADHWARQFASDLKPPFLFRCLPNGGHWYLVYKYRTGQFDAMLRKYFSDTRLEQFPIPSCAVTLDLISGEAIVRDQGDVVHAILESINLPGLSVPIFRNGQALVDGGLVKNIPADVLVNYGCNFVIAVSVTAKIEHEFPPKRSRSPTSTISHASTIQTIMRSLLVQNKNVNSFGLQPADAVIEPDVTPYALTEFVRAEEMAEIGARATVVELPAIKEQLMQLDNRLFADVGKPCV